MNVIRVALFGPLACGKSSLAQCLARENFNRSYFPTIGVDVKNRTVPEKQLKLIIWDLSGDPRFSPIVHSYIYSTGVIFLCYDAGSYTSYQRLLDGYNDIKHLLNNKTVCVVALKNDLCTQGFKSYEWGRDLAIRLDCPFIATSAVNNDVKQVVSWLGEDNPMHYEHRKCLDKCILI